jgi:hypothetical protein
VNLARQLGGGGGGVKIWWYKIKDECLHGMYN